MSDLDARMMERALSLASMGAGAVSPNPLVGAVLVKDGRIIGEGFHRSYGGPHAEAEAIAAATEPVEGSTLYCNLEPCCHHSPDRHQSPCTELIITRRIARVCVANRDPNPLVDGKGLAALEAAGIAVEEGLLATRGQDLNEIFFHAMRTGTPFVHLKMAQSLDGRIATGGGDSKWITDEAARREAHILRSRYDAVMVGSITVRIDDPGLTVRLCPGRDPLRVVLSSRLEIPLDAKILGAEAEKGLVAFRVKGFDRELLERERALQARGVRVFAVGEDGNGGLDLPEVLDQLWRLSVRSVLVEGGRGLFSSFFRSGSFQKLSAFIAPVIIGNGIGSVGDIGVTRVAGAPRLARVGYRAIGDQILVTGYREEQDVHGDR